MTLGTHSFASKASFLAFIICYWISLSRLDESVLSIFNLLSYASFVLFVVIHCFLIGAFSGSKIQLLSLFLFLFFSAFFTAAGVVDAQALLAFFGYVLLFITYSLFASRAVAAEDIASALSISTVPFLFLSFAFIGDDSAYTFAKNQFSGFFNNPNQFAAACGLFFITKLYDLNHKKLPLSRRLWEISIVIGLLALLLLSGARAATAATAISGVMMFNIRRHALKLLLISLILAVGVYSIMALGLLEMRVERSLFEETGRGNIMISYIDLIDKNALLWGAGLSREGERIRSELSYLDLLTVAGVGGIAFIVFVGLSLKFALEARKHEFGKLVFSIVLFVSALSVFEGHLGGVMSVLAIIFYVMSGAAYRLSRAYPVNADTHYM